MKTKLIVLGVLVVIALGVFMFIAPGVENLPQRGALEGYTRDASYIYILAPGKEVHGTKYTIPSNVADGTNLAHDTYISYEELPGATGCTPNQFLEDVQEVKEVVDDGNTYLVAHNVGAGAGNRYDETVYVFKGYTPCTAIRYYIHYGVIENYPEGAVKAFDQDALVASFDSVRRTLARSR
jgi:hypothetical protein